MRLIPLASITIPPDRQRQLFDPERLADLQDSISRLGLIQPLVVADDGTLIAGERRLKCLDNLHMFGEVVMFDGKLVPEGMVPAVLPSEAGPLAHFEIELEENIKRHDLTWQEHATALSRLNELRIRQAERDQTAPPTIADLAEEVEGRRDGAYQAKTRKSLIVSQHMNNPEVAKAKSVDEAFKILKKQEQAATNAEIAATVGAHAVTDLLDVHHANCLDWGWQYVEDGRPLFDILCTDPPYGMDAQAFGDAGGSHSCITHEYADTKEEWLTLMNRFAQLSWAITKANAHLYVACDLDGFHHLREIFRAAGWRVHRTPIVYVKKDANRVPWPSQGPRRSYELVLYAVRGAKTTTAIYSDVFEGIGDDNLGHGAQKPVAFWENLLRRSAVPGDRVLDPFAGTGGILVAAHSLNLRCSVVEQEAQYYGICASRLEALK